MSSSEQAIWTLGIQRNEILEQIKGRVFKEQVVFRSPETDIVQLFNLYSLHGVYFVYKVDI